MNKEEMLINRLSMILNKEDIKRIKIKKNNETNVEEFAVDLHNLGTKDAMVLVNNIINLNRDECEIEVIHGYNHGIALKDMINSRFHNPRIMEKKSVARNMGITILACKGMC